MAFVHQYLESALSWHTDPPGRGTGDRVRSRTTLGFAPRSGDSGLVLNRTYSDPVLSRTGPDFVRDGTASDPVWNWTASFFARGRLVLSAGLGAGCGSLNQP